MSTFHNPQMSVLQLDVAEVLTARDLELLLKIDVKTIYRYVQHGLTPYVRIQFKCGSCGHKFWSGLESATINQQAVFIAVLDKSDYPPQRLSRESRFSSSLPFHSVHLVSLLLGSVETKGKH